MKTKRFMYHLKYDVNEKGLCEIEMRSLFQVDLNENVFFESKKIHPSTSPFLRNRLEIIYVAKTVTELIAFIQNDQLAAVDFMVKYVKMKDNDPDFKQRRASCKAIGLSIRGSTSFTEPKTIFGITFYKGSWYFGKLVERSLNWNLHNKKPYSYSSSISLNIAKALINIASNGDKSKRLIDPCCGVGTVLLEGAMAGYDIKGVEINRKTAQNARENLRYFNYDISVVTGDIKDIDEQFDVSIIDLPYGNFSLTNDATQLTIIRNAKRIAKKVILVSSEDIRDDILSEHMSILDYCEIGKDAKRDFLRYIWVCERDNDF